MQKVSFIFFLKNVARNLIDHPLIEQFLKKILIKHLLLKPKPMILMFHMISPIDRNGIPQIENLKVSSEFFEYIIKTALFRGRHFLSLDELYEVLFYKKKLDNNSILITFDDGYKDNFTYAYPILKKYNIPFVIYINSGFINKEFYPWWFAVSDLVKQKKIIFYNKKKFNVDSKSKKEKFYLFMRNRLINSLKDEIKKCLDLLSKENKCDLYQKNDLFMSWKEIKELLKYPKFVLGSHTYFHLNLTVLDKKQIIEEVHKDIITIEEKTGRRITHVSYPFGLVNENVISVMRSLSFKTGVSTKPGFLSSKCDILTLPRLFLRERPTSLLKLYFNVINFNV